jgi:diacylglycerol kinase (ATP)
LHGRAHHDDLVASGAVKVGLIYNPDAGDALTVEQLAEALERHGHHMERTVTPDAGLEALHLDGLDAVVAAGGDGTIATVAVGLAGTGVPLGILPMGTANNIALSLDIPAGLDEAIATWQQARTRLLDVGSASGPWGEHKFVESVGGGLVTHGIVVMDRQTAPRPQPEVQLARALRAHADVLALADPVPWRLILDDQPVAGEYLLVEVLNMRAIGPNLVLADAASPWDGKFTIVAATADDRDEVAHYLRGRADGKATPLTLPTWHAAAVTIEAGDRLHVDDEVVGEPGPQSATIRMQAAAVPVLVPDIGPHLRDRSSG